MDGERSDASNRRKSADIYKEQESNTTDDEEFSKVTPTEEPWTDSDDTDAQRKNFSEELDSDESKYEFDKVRVKSDRSSMSEQPKHTKQRTRSRTSNREVLDKRRKKKKKRDRKVEEKYKDEVPITEILKRAQESCQTKYEEPVPLPALTTNTIYIQRKNSFSAIKISEYKDSRDKNKLQKDKKECSLSSQNCYPPITVAISAEKCWKSFRLVYQGLLGGMAFAHLIMIQVFFEYSIYFVVQYSIFSEIYTSLFSFLIVLCVVSIFDKFDIAHVNMDHLYDICSLNMKSVMAIPMYLAALCLHEASSMADDQLALLHYRGLNDSLWSNNSYVETVLEDLSVWRKITISKDLLAILGWFFVSIGTRDDMLLMYLQSMQKYANDVFLK